MILSPLTFSQSYQDEYKRVIDNTRRQIIQYLQELSSNRTQDINWQINMITQQLSNIPYLFDGAMGEGDWQPISSSYKPGALHIDQHPLYRLDGLDCQTFVQVAMGLLYSQNLHQFDNTIVKVAYGAAGDPRGEFVRFYNRNNFIDGDFNPINQKNGFLIDATSKGSLAPYAQQIQATITRQKWFSVNAKRNLHLINSQNKSAIESRLTKTYTNLNYPHFKSQDVTMLYIPKSLLALINVNGEYRPNLFLLHKIPTPSIAEVVMDPKQWKIRGRNIKTLIGSQTSISHFGFLYQQTFKKGDLIYHKINCYFNFLGRKICQVETINCLQPQCHRLMFAHATDAYPVHFYWYQINGQFVCSAEKPRDKNRHFTTCNRVERLPLYDYISHQQYGSYVFMQNPAILGIHIEKLIHFTTKSKY